MDEHSLTKEQSSMKDRVRLRHILSEAEGYLELDMPEAALRALQRWRGNPTAHYLYLHGEVYRELGRYEEALRWLHRAAELKPDRPHIWLAMGWCHKRTDRLDLAIQDLEQAVMVAPEEPLAHFNLACYLSLAGRAPEAADHLARSIKLEPEVREMVEEESDFDPIREDPHFRRVIGASGD